jgi:hypothetical protein
MGNEAGKLESPALTCVPLAGFLSGFLQSLGTQLIASTLPMAAVQSGYRLTISSHEQSILTLISR